MGLQTGSYHPLEEFTHLVGNTHRPVRRRRIRRSAFFPQQHQTCRTPCPWVDGIRHLENSCRSRGTKVSIDSAQTRPGIPTGPGATSRDAILFVATSNSSSVTRSSSFHSVHAVPSMVVGTGVDVSLLYRRGNRVPITFSSNTGSMFSASGGPKVAVFSSLYDRASPTDLNRPIRSAHPKTEL